MITRGKFIFLAEMLTLFGLMLNSSCTKEIEHGDPPKLPPSEAFLMSFINFPIADDSIKSKLNSTVSDTTHTYANWEYAHNAISEWFTVADFPMAVSITCYREALKIDPIYIGNNTFGWSCNFLYQDDLYSARLVGNWIADMEFKVEMYIAKIGTNGFSRFKWLEGTVRHDWTRGTWFLYESPENPRRLLRIDWNKNWDKKTGDIKYTYMRQGQLPSGSYIQFKINNEFYHDASYTIIKPGKKVVIEWNRTNNSGHISDPLKYNDYGGWHCWTEMLQDINCE